MVFWRGVAPLLGGETCDDGHVVYRLGGEAFAFHKPLGASFTAVVADGGHPLIPVFLGHLGQILGGMFQRVGGVIGVF